MVRTKVSFRKNSIGRKKAIFILEDNFYKKETRKRKSSSSKTTKTSIPFQETISSED